MMDSMPKALSQMMQSIAEDHIISSWTSTSEMNTTTLSITYEYDPDKCLSRILDTAETDIAYVSNRNSCSAHAAVPTCTYCKNDLVRNDHISHFPYQHPAQFNASTQVDITAFTNIKSTREPAVLSRNTSTTMEPAAAGPNDDFVHVSAEAAVEAASQKREKRRKFSKPLLDEIVDSMGKLVEKIENSIK